MFLKYLGKTKNFTVKDFNFSNGPVEVPHDLGLALLKENPRSFVQVVMVGAEVPPEAPPAPDAKAKSTKSTKA